MNCAFHPKMLFIKGFRYAYDVIICVCLTFEKVPCSQYRCKPTEDLVCMFNIQPTAVLNKSLHEPPKSCLHYLSSININRRQHYPIICIVVCCLHHFISQIFVKTLNLFELINSYFIGRICFDKKAIFLYLYFYWTRVRSIPDLVTN